MKLPSDEDIVISGISGRYPKSSNLYEFWDNLVNARQTIRDESNRWPKCKEYKNFPKFSGFLECHDQFDGELFDFSDEKSNDLYPQDRLLLETIYEALYDAGLDPFSVGGERTGCFIGNCYNESCKAMQVKDFLKNKSHFNHTNNFFSDTFNIKGVSFLVDSACASSFSALNQALLAFKSGEIDFAIVGTNTIQLNPVSTLLFSILGTLSQKEINSPLDAAADGYNRSEAVVTLILQKRRDAKRIYSSIYHIDTNCDGYKKEGMTFPSTDAQLKLMKKVYEDCKLDPERYITYVEAHMTATVAGDPVESDALVKALRPNKSRPLMVGCLKSNIGHTEASSAHSAISKVALIFQLGFIPPNINYKNPNPKIPSLNENLIVPVLENTLFDEDFIPINSFGIGGVNSHGILKANEKQAVPQDYEIFKSRFKLPKNWYSRGSLRKSDEFNSFVQNKNSNDMIRLVNLTNRTVEGCKYAIDFIEKNLSKINNDFFQLIEDQSFIDPKTKLNHHAYLILSPERKILSKKIVKIERKKPLYVIFSGLGSQWVQMGTDLLQIEIFARKIVELDQFTTSRFNFSLISFITEEMDENFLNKEETNNTLLAISSIQMALLDLLRFLEVEVTAFIGHSLGEYTCAYAMGYATSEQVLELLYQVTTIFDQNLPKGSMASVGLSWKDCEARLPKNLHICCENSSQNVTIGGPTELVNQFLEKLKKEEIFTCKVESYGQVSHARPWTEKVHNQLLKEFNKILGTRKYVKSSKWISTSIPRDAAHPDTLARYLANNPVNPVYFKDAISNLENDICCIELGPHAQLLAFIKQEKDYHATCIASMKRDDKEKNLINFFVAIGELFNNGIVTKISKLFTPVKYPVSRQTLSLSHLLKLDHSIPKFFTRYPEFFDIVSVYSVVKISFEDPNYKSWYDHVIDERILLPTTGYLFLLSSHISKKSSYLKETETIASIQMNSLELFNVSLKKAVVLDKNSPTEITIKYHEDTGKFSMMESNQECCTGFVRIIEDCEKKIDHLLFKPKESEKLEIIKKEDFYKELRVRGYDYEGEFQGVVVVNANGREGKVKYANDNWVSFADSLLQVLIIGEKSRSLLVPTQIEYMRCEIEALEAFNQDCLKNKIDPVFDVYFDPFVGIGATHGMNFSTFIQKLIKGIKVSEVKRKEKVKPTLNEYAFVPYENKFKLGKDTVAKNKKYEEILSKLIEVYAKKIQKLEEVDLEMKELKEKYNETGSHSMLNLLLDIIQSNYLIQEDEEKSSKDEEKLELNKTIIERQEQLSHDLIFTNNYLQLLASHISIVLENSSTKQINLLEINFTSSLMQDFLSYLISSFSQNSVEYNLLHPMPTMKSITSKHSINKVLEMKSIKSISTEISSSDIVVYKHWTTGYVNNLEALELNQFKPDEKQEQELVKNAFDHLNDGGFLILCYRTKLTYLEEQLMKFGKQDTTVEMINKETLLNYINDAGFEYIGEEQTENETDCCSILARKVLKEFVDIENALEPIPIEIKLFDYRWVEKVKKQLRNKSQKRIWLIARDSSLNGIIGMVKCLRKESDGERIRCLFNIDACNDQKFIEDKIKNGLDNQNEEEEKEIDDVEDENVEELKKMINKELIEKDLAMNVILGGKLGSYRQKNIEEEVSVETEFAVLDCLSEGDLSSFRWLKSHMKESAAYPSLLYPLQTKLSDEKKLKLTMMDIYYSALNFRDVMLASGRLTKSAYPSTVLATTNLIGMEFSGKQMKNGKRVMGILPGGGISTKFLCIENEQIFEVPDNWSLADAATVPVVYLTAYYSLFIRGNLLPGEKVLIHAGSGGVGFAAISICLAHGCEVFTTVSTKEKKKFLQKHFPTLRDRNFTNSRDVSFEEHILKETDGYGVDIVLNSLSEEKLKASLRCLAKYGRFLEIGRYDIMLNNPIDTTELSENKTFHCVCLAHLLAELVENNDSLVNKKWEKTCELLKEGIKNGEVKPLNYSLFSKDECEQAFRFMANGKHMGKVLIEIRKEDDIELKHTIVRAIPTVILIPSKSYILTGGLGGFGLELALWLIKSGCRQLIITSRTGIKNEYQKMQVRSMREQDCNVVISNEICDTLESTQRLLDQADSMGKLGGIFHLAMVLNDAIFINQTSQSFQSVCKSKINATFFLDHLTKDQNKYNELDYFICFSSIASAIGNPGQSNYAFANSAMERIVEKRSKDQGSNSNCKNFAIQWGAVGDVGVFAEKFGNNVNIAGMLPQRMISCKKTMEQIMSYKIPVLSSVVIEDRTKHSLGKSEDLVKKIMNVLGITDTSNIDPNTTLIELGMDSLMAVEIKQGLERDYDILMTEQEIRDLTYGKLQEISAEKIKKMSDVSANEDYEKDNAERIEDTFNFKNNLFVELHSDQKNLSNSPIFFLPPIEGDFVIIRKMVKYLFHPVIGISWIDEFDECNQIKDVAEIIAKRLVEKHGACEYFLVGYSFGALLALEIAVQLQNYDGVIVRKLLMLDSSPDFLKAESDEILMHTKTKDKNSDELISKAIISLGTYLLGTSNPIEFTEKLSQLPNLDSKLQFLKTESLSGFKIDPDSFLKQAKRLIIKVKMSNEFHTVNKFEGDIELIRASVNTFDSKKMPENYGIEKYCTGRADFIKLMGDHKTFIINNAEEIGNKIDDSFSFVSL